MDKKKLIVPAVLVFLLAACEVLKMNPVLIESTYSRGIYPVVIRALNRVSGWVPFSLFEALICCLLVALAVILGILGVRLLARQQEKGHWRQTALRLLSLVLGFAVLFNVLWGFNYYRLPLSEQLGIPMQKHSRAELAALCKRMIQEANTLSEAVDRDAQGAMKPDGEARSVLERAPVGFREMPQKLGFFKGRYGAPKPVWNSVAMSYAGIAGMYSPFTAEANVNVLLPASLLPATAQHEMAHVYGYAREDEANFIAWLSCRFHPDADFRYSGALLGLIYSMNALYGVDPIAFQQLKQGYSLGVKMDLAANKTFWKQYEGPAEKIHDRVNDRYLKANGQTDGVESYGRMVDLLLEVDGGVLKIDK